MSDTVMEVCKHENTESFSRPYPQPKPQTLNPPYTITRHPKSPPPQILHSASRKASPVPASFSQVKPAPMLVFLGLWRLLGPLGPLGFWGLGEVFFREVRGSAISGLSPRLDSFWVWNSYCQGCGMLVGLISFGAPFPLFSGHPESSRSSRARRLKRQ